MQPPQSSSLFTTIDANVRRVHSASEMLSFPTTIVTLREVMINPYPNHTAIRETNELSTVIVENIHNEIKIFVVYCTLHCQK